MDKISAAAELIKRFEGFSAKPYPDAGGFSIGYGHFIQPGEDLTNVSKNDAEQLLRWDMQTAQNAVDELVIVPLTLNQNSALVSFVYNIGVEAFKNSTALKRLNSGDYQGAADAMTWFNKSQGKINNTLVSRRAIERNLFLT